MDEILLAVARMKIEPSSPTQQADAVANKIYISNLESKENISLYLMTNLIHQLKRIIFHLNLNLLVVEVGEDNEMLQQLLDKEGFLETGGYLSEKGMIFKYSISMKGDDKGILHQLPAPSVAAETDHEVNENENEENIQHQTVCYRFNLFSIFK